MGNPRSRTSRCRRRSGWRSKPKPGRTPREPQPLADLCAGCMIGSFACSGALKLTTAYITHPDCLRHEMGPGHPECPARLSSINEHMRSSGLLDELRCLEAPLADPDDLKRVHRPADAALIFDN